MTDTLIIITQNQKLGGLLPDAHNMKCPYQCQRTDLDFLLCFLIKYWLGIYTVSGNNHACITNAPVNGVLLMSLYLVGDIMVNALFCGPRDGTPLKVLHHDMTTQFFTLMR